MRKTLCDIKEDAVKKQDRAPFLRSGEVQSGEPVRSIADPSPSQELVAFNRNAQESQDARRTRRQATGVLAKIEIRCAFAEKMRLPLREMVHGDSISHCA